MSSPDSKGLRSPPEAVPEGLVIGTPGSVKSGGANLPRVMKRIAADLMRRFPLMISEDPKRFKKQAVYHLKRNLPPRPGRPMEDAISKAIEMRNQGYPWKQIYPVCIANHAVLPPAERRVAQDNLRAARRSRRNAAKRRRRRGTCPSEAKHVEPCGTSR
jgi:hypothetical protein